MTGVTLLRRLVRETTYHVDQSIGTAVGEALAKRLSNKRTIATIVERLVERDDLYTPADRSGLTQDTVRRTADVVMETLRPVVVQLVEQAIRDVMIKWNRW